MLEDKVVMLIQNLGVPEVTQVVMVLQELLEMQAGVPVVVQDLDRLMLVA